MDRNEKIKAMGKEIKAAERELEMSQEILKLKKEILELNEALEYGDAEWDYWKRRALGEDV